jgi:hypothetical protein
MTTSSHSPRGLEGHIAPIVAALVLLAAGSCLSSTTPAAVAASHDTSYGWPVTPFDQAHPIRGNFGDPRTIFFGPPTQRTLLGGAGSFQFHFGVDVSAPDGTPVYPVVSGRVQFVDYGEVIVDAGDGRTFEYWHILPAVSVGQQVDVDSTVLGRILKGQGHVHLTERDGGVAVNPLAPGHLEPYSDHTKPRVDAVYFRRSVTSSDLMPELLRGRVEIIASAYDMPSLPVPGEWNGLPVTPALVTWRVEQAVTHRVVVRDRVAFDVRHTFPSNGLFWSVFARGTQQNMCVFGKHYSYMQPGHYLFRLAPGGFDTRTLRDSVYDLIVTATDIRGNSSSLVERFSVHNKPGVLGT